MTVAQYKLKGGVCMELLTGAGWIGVIPSSWLFVGGICADNVADVGDI